MINISSNQFGHPEIYFFFARNQFSFTHRNSGRKKQKIEIYQFHSLFFSFLSLFLDQKLITKLTQVLPTTSLGYIWYPPSLNNHKELGIALYFVVQRNMYVCLMERYFILSYHNRYTEHLPPPSEELSAFYPLCNYCQPGLPSYNNKIIAYLLGFILKDFLVFLMYVLQPLAN